MLLEAKQIVSKIGWKAVLIIAVFMVGFIVSERTLVGLIAAIGVPPLLIILACALPCIAPIAYLRRKQMREK